MLWHTDASLSSGDAAMDVAAAVLGQGRSSRFYTALVQEQEIALEADAYQMSQLLGSVFMVQGKPTDGHTIEELEAAMQSEVDRLATDGPTAEEMERVANTMEMAFLEGLEDLQSRASALNRYRAIKGDPGWVANDLARYRAVTADDVKAAAERLNADRRGIMRVRPEPADAGEGAE
jgi:zinc protease